ncbi:nuclease-related domain-containing protein [Streptomyces sp. NPDC102259]|uniref:nuclease-related domain-containing protein n=1 Tax=Streptomyces sp. NPDC102259 TaxID=3366148 RepID=UPI0037F8C696
MDHLAIGPAGVFAINSKRHRGKSVWYGDAAITVNGATTRHIAISQSEARRIARVLSRHCGVAVPVRPVISVVHAARLTVKSANPSASTSRRGWARSGERGPRPAPLYAATSSSWFSASDVVRYSASPGGTATWTPVRSRCRCSYSASTGAWSTTRPRPRRPRPCCRFRRSALRLSSAGSRRGSWPSRRPASCGRTSTSCSRRATGHRSNPGTSTADSSTARPGPASVRSGCTTPTRPVGSHPPGTAQAGQASREARSGVVAVLRCCTTPKNPCRISPAGVLSCGGPVGI